MKPDQERVRSLLTDTVTLLCKNGLLFRKELKVEGVLGITLDNDDVFIVHINERVAENCIAELSRCNDLDVGIAGNANKNIGSISTNYIKPSDKVQFLTDSVPHSRLLRPHHHFLQKDVHPSSANTISIKRRRKEHFLSRRFVSDSSGALELSSFKCETFKDLQSDKSKYEDDVVFNRSPNGMNFLMKKCEDRPTIAEERGEDEVNSVVEICSDLESIKTNSKTEQMGLNLSVKEERSIVDQDESEADVVMTMTTGLKKIEPELRKNEIYCMDDPTIDMSTQNDNNESIQKWLSQFMPLSSRGIDAGVVVDGFPTNNKNNNNNINQLKVKWTDRGERSVLCGETIPTKVTNVPLVTDLIMSAKSRRPYQSTSIHRAYNTCVDPLSLSLPISFPDKHDNLSYDEMTAPSPRRPRSSLFKPYICQIPGCRRMFFRGSELYRHQREKHGAEHIRPRGTSLTFLDN